MSTLGIIGCVIGGISVVVTVVLVVFIVKRPREYVGDGKFE